MDVLSTYKLINSVRPKYGNRIILKDKAIETGKETQIIFCKTLGYCIDSDSKDNLESNSKVGGGIKSTKKIKVIMYGCHK